MRKCICQCLLALLLWDCNNGKEEISSLFSKSISLNKVFEKELTASSFTEYSLAGEINSASYSDYPKDIWKKQGWKVKHWSSIKTKSELKDIISFLQQEKTKYNHSAENREITPKIDTIISVLENQSEKYLMSYFYKEEPGKDRIPPASNGIYTGWLFFYYLDVENKKVIRITNAYR